MALESASSSEEEIVYADDPFKEAQAYNYSIYLMVVMPYLLLGTVGFLIYRSYKKAQASQQASQELPTSDERNNSASPPGSYHQEL